MATGRGLTPGTVSNILWHFTGGPVWDSAAKKQSNRPKPPEQAYANLKSILKSGELRLGSYKERIHVILPELRARIRNSSRFCVVHRDPVDVESSPVCCLADIPTPHLSYHARRYGRFAIGFHRNAVVRAGFNPVFYALHNAPTIQSIYKGFAAINKASVKEIRSAIGEIEVGLCDLEDQEQDTIGASSALYDILSEADLIDKRISTARRSLSDFVAFVKTFDRTEFNTIYCEREWRSVKQFDFALDDIAMVVLPREIGVAKYFRRFVEKSAIAKSLPRGVPIVAWEDLVEC